jgi:tetratricopeptide (TPR) repeat protein
MGDEDELWDVFLCYKWEDAEAAEPLRLALTVIGLRVFQDVIEGEIWAPLAASIRRALDRSRTLVALITPNFPNSPHCREELHLALSAAYYLDDGDTSRVMAVIRDMSPDNVRPRQLTRFRLPRSNVLPEDLAPKIAGIVARYEERFGDAPEPQDPRWYPHELAGDRFFRGRYNELWELHEGLLARTKNRDRGHPVVAVGAPGGFGKTALCLQYARLFQRDHPGGVFVLRLGGSDGRAGLGDAAVENTHHEQLALVARKLRLRGPDEIEAALEEIGEPYLWLLDDVPSTTSFELVRRLWAPTQRGKTLITTRGRFARFASMGLDLTPLDDDIGGRVLTSYGPAEPAERGAVRDVVRLLGGHPLGLTLAAGLTTTSDFTGYPALLADLSTAEPDRLEVVAAGLEGQLPAGCVQPFANALLRSFDALGDAARQVLGAASVLAPTVIPYDVLRGMVRRVAGIDAEQFDEGLERAAVRGLLDRTNVRGCTMHALVARAVRIRVEPAVARTCFRNAALVELTAAVDRTRGAYRHPDVLYHLPHVRAVVGLLPGGDSWPIGDDERHLLNETGRTQIEAGQTRNALANFRALRAACEGIAEVDLVTHYAVLSGLAAAYGLEGEYTTALQLKQQAVNGLADILGHDHADTLTALNNLAVSHLNLGHYEQAHSMFREVYLGRRNHRDLGKTHRDTLVALNNLAIARGHLGGSPAEQDRHRRVAHRYWLGGQARWRKVAKPDDQYALDVLNGLALSYRALGMLNEALETIEDLYERRRALLGPDHSDTLGTLENKLIIQGELNDEPDEAFQSILLGRLCGQGPGHYQTGVTMRNLIRSELQTTTGVGAVPAELPDGVTPDGVRLDGDHVDADIDLQQLAMALQQERVDTFGGDDPRTMMATIYLAYSLAAADHLDGQLEWAHMAEDAYEGIADAADDHVDHLGVHDVEIARLIRDWIAERLGRSDA